MTEAEEFNSQQAKLVTLFDYEDIEFMYEPDEFEQWLYKSDSIRQKKRTRHGIYSTLQECRQAFVGMDRYLSVERLNDYKKALIDNDKASGTINGKINALAVYTRYLAEKYDNKNILKITTRRLSVQPKQYIENVISRADYDFLVENAKKSKNPNLYLGIKIMGTTGVRMSELLQVKVEHIKHGYVDILGKGAKRRRVYFPKKAREELLQYLSQLPDADSGYVLRYWLKKKGEKTGAFEKNTRDLGEFSRQRTFIRSFQHALQRFGTEVGVDSELMHAHGFRHFFAKEFLKNRMDISLLADLLGHSSLEVTRIYLKMTSREQADVVDEVVTW